MRVPSPMFGQYTLDLRVNSIRDTGSRLRGARGIYYPRGPFFRRELVTFATSTDARETVGAKHKLSRGERRYRMAVLTIMLKQE